MVKTFTQRSVHPSFIASQIREYRYFFLNLTPSPRSKLTLACGGWERCAPDYRVERADLEFYGLEYVISGKGILTVDGIEHKLRSNSVFAYRPFAAHSIQTSSDDPLVKYFIDFSGRDARRIINRKVLGPHGICHLHHAHHIPDLFEQIMEAGLKGGVMAQRLGVILLELLALRIEENTLSSPIPGGLARQSFERCREELQQNFRTIHSVADLATLTHFDPAYLSRLFDRFAGESPYGMLTRLKMNEAASHLVGARSTVKEVAAQVGFTDPYHFSRVFKKHHGVSPAGFMQQVRPHAKRPENRIAAGE